LIVTSQLNQFSVNNSNSKQGLQYQME